MPGHIANTVHLVNASRNGYENKRYVCTACKLFIAYTCSSYCPVCKYLLLYFTIHIVLSVSYL